MGWRDRLVPGQWLPWIGFYAMPLRADFETAMPGERAPYVIRLLAIEWFGCGMTLLPYGRVRDAKTGAVVPPEGWPDDT